MQQLEVQGWGSAGLRSGGESHDDSTLEAVFEARLLVADQPHPDWCESSSCCAVSQAGQQEVGYSQSGQ
jgi:hypothetical protein